MNELGLVPCLICRDCFATYFSSNKNKKSVNLEQVANNLNKDYKHKYCLFCGREMKTISGRKLEPNSTIY